MLSSPESTDEPPVLFDFSDIEAADQRHTRNKVTGIVLLVALLAIIVVAWVSPQARVIPPGPTPDQVALQREQARADDLKRRLDDLNVKLTKGKPPVVDGVQQARADDLANQLAELQANDPRGDDLRKQLMAANAKLTAPDPPKPDLVAVARANDLAHQNDLLAAELARPRPPIEPVITASLTKAQIVAGRNLFGLYTQQSPFSYAEIDKVQGDLGRRANIVGYFQSWNDPFRVDALKDTWAHGQIPLMTWEPQSQVGNITNSDAQFSLPNIIGGAFDDYIRSYADGIKASGLPVIIRLAHEMNGTWYPWSEFDISNGQPVNGNHVGDYAQMWRHVHDIFQVEGANDYAIWLWAPNRVNKIPHQPSPARFYPGDDYVDWIGMSGYYRPGDPSATFANAYGLTLPWLRDASANRPIFLAEIGATEDGSKKGPFINSVFAGLAANPDVIGFAWFSLTVTSTNENGRNTNDWRIDSSGNSITTMSTQLAAAGYGLVP